MGERKREKGERGKGREGGRQRETLICCLTSPRIYWLTLPCALTGDRTCNPGTWRQCFNLLDYQARAQLLISDCLFLTTQALLCNISNTEK